MTGRAVPGWVLPTTTMLIGSLLAAASLSAATVTLAWDAPTTYTDGSPVGVGEIAGYVLTYREEPLGALTTVAPLPQTTATLSTLTPGATYTASVTGVDTVGTIGRSSLPLTFTVAQADTSNHPPVATGDTGTTPQGVSLSLAVLTNDSDPDGQALTLTAVTQGQHGAVSLVGETVLYVPVPGYVGSDTFTYTIMDTQGGVATGTVIVQVFAPNQPPTPTADTVTIPVATPVTIAVLSNDTDPEGSPLTVTGVTQGQLGLVAFTPTSVTYTPLLTTDTFTYTVTDSTGASGVATVTVQVLPVVPPPVTGLVAAYSFNATSGTIATDSSGFGHHGVVTGATWVSTGKYGGALRFQGGSHVVTIPDAPALRLTSGMTLSAWVYPTAALSGWRSLIDKNIDGYYLMASSSAQNRPTVGGSWGTGTQNTPGPTTLPLNTWTHLAGTFDGTTVRVYLNGTQVASQGRSGPLVVKTGTLQIGANSYGENFVGLIDNVRVYNKALTAAEIMVDKNTPVP